MPDRDTWPRVIVFDLDGTLADTATDIRHALNQALAQDGVAPVDSRCARYPGAESPAR